jgi:hypothetical protein
LAGEVAPRNFLLIGGTEVKGQLGQSIIVKDKYMKIELTEDEIKGMFPSSELAEAIADKIVEEKTNSQWDEFDGELLAGVRVATKRIVDEIMDSYGGKENIKSLVEERLKNMTRDEIIKALSSNS